MLVTVLRWLLVVVLTGHGLIHLLGAAKGLGWAGVPQLTEPIGPRAGLLWLLASVLVLVAAVLLAVGPPSWWWALALAAAVTSQVAVVTSWSDAWAGTLVNVVLLLAAVLSFASVGPGSFHADYQQRAAQALAQVDPSPPTVTEADLADLPTPLADYVRRSGAVGRPRVAGFQAEFHGRIRGGLDEDWMPFTGRQVNTYGPRPQRIFLMDATRAGLPVTVLHEYADATARMRVKLLSLFTMVDTGGPEMDRGETVTVFNDLVVLAPGAIVGAPVTWTAVDDRHVRGTFTSGGQVVSAVLTFDADHDLVDFVSDDRTRSSSDGTSFTPQRWSTPISGHRDDDGWRVITLGEGVWHAPEPEGTFTYLELHLDTIDYQPE